jgi:hypothetical protein
MHKHPVWSEVEEGGVLLFGVIGLLVFFFNGEPHAFWFGTTDEESLHRVEIGEA